MIRKFTHLSETRSTNQWMQDEFHRTGGEEGWLVYADFQTAGRGQRGNHWESEAGANLLFTLLLQPGNLPANRQFALSEAVALGCVDYLARWADGFSVKWPNDIYWQEKKLAGILIENDLRGSLVHDSFVGIGANMNQTRFVSDAPNPVSLRQITGQEVRLDEALNDIYEAILRRYRQLDTPAALHADYLGRLFRFGVEAPFQNDCRGVFMATITGVEPTGHLLLRENDGSENRYFFKEVKHVIGGSAL